MKQPILKKLPLQLAIVGFGRLGRACAAAALEDEQLALAGIVRRPKSLEQKPPAPFAAVPAVAHAGELERVDAALVCVPTEVAAEVAQAYLRHGIPIVECAALGVEALQDHHHKLGRLAAMRGTTAIVGAGWDPGALSLLRALFALLIPRGHTQTSRRTAANLHHTTAARSVAGVREALSTELRSGEGKLQRYVYVELEEGADPARVEAAIRSDPLFLGEETLVFAVEDIGALEEEGRGVLLERRGSAAAPGHPMLLLEARFDRPTLAAAIMTAAARAIPFCKEGGYTLFDLPPAALWGALRKKADW